MTAEAKIPRSPAQAGGGMTQNYASFLTMNSAMMEAFAEASQAYMQRMAALNEELMGFASDRMQRNSKASESLMKCKDWNDAVKVQQEWLKGVSEQYLSEFTKLVEMSTKAALAGLNPLVERTSETLTELRKVG